MSPLTGWHGVLHEEQATVHQTDRQGASVKALTCHHSLQNVFWAAELANDTLSRFRPPSLEGPFLGPAGDNGHLPAQLPNQGQILHLNVGGVQLFPYMMPLALIAECQIRYKCVVLISC